MSHARIWRDIVEKGYQTALVLEDDVRLVSNFNFKLKFILDEVKDLDWT
jgi:GR25 family glycosyltransferase involved in LPS biosynthesis